MAKGRKETDKQALTKREHDFLLYFMAGNGKRQAAIMAGIPIAGAHIEANRILGRQRVQDAIEEIRQPDLDNLRIRRQLVLDKLFRVAMADTSQAFDDDWKLKPKEEIPAEVLLMLNSVRTWDSLEQGSGCTARFDKPVEAMRAYLKYCDLGTEDSGPITLDDAFDEVKVDMEMLIRRIEAEDED